MSNAAKLSPVPAATLEIAAAVPNYEVKFYLDPLAILDVAFEPTRDAGKVLDLKNSNRTIAMLFLDAKPSLLHGEGWSVRARKFEGSDKLELSYKRRYPIAPKQLAAALDAASADGFDAREDDYAAQVEWGFQKQTLSFTRKKEFAATGHGEMDLPTVEEMRALAVRDIPGKLDRWKKPGWARGVLTGGHLYGPVLGKRWAGEWQGPALSFEVWLIRTASGPGYEPVVELSFKAKTQTEANGFREKLAEIVRDRGWLLERDVLKTTMILERY